MNLSVARALILTYHAIEPGPPPLCCHPELFRAQLDEIAASGARVVTVSALAERVADPDETLVALTFDDGFASVLEHALPALAERNLPATIYCVAGRLGGRNDWPSAHPGGFVSDLLSDGEVGKLAEAGIEVGSHGFLHAPLRITRGEQLEQEIIGSKDALEELLGRPVRSFALPYGALPTSEGRELLERSYGTVCTTRPALAGAGADLQSLPRIDAYYLRRRGLVRRALEGSLGPYLAARRLGSGARRAFRKDYAGA